MSWDTSFDAYENQLKELRDMREAERQFAEQEASRRRDAQEAGIFLLFEITPNLNIFCILLPIIICSTLSFFVPNME